MLVLIFAETIYGKSRFQKIFEWFINVKKSYIALLMSEFQSIFELFIQFFHAVVFSQEPTNCQPLTLHLYN